jgi:predicted AlkP superfamily pyrophosphatase or phosphodiesterase
MKIRPISWLALAAVALSCRSAAPQSPQTSPPPRRVVLLSLDGASSDTLHRLYREGALTAGGFARFFQEGQVADGLVPVDPSLTAVNHISLATGYFPERTGIVANTFHPAGAPFLDTVSGFAAPIATETLWEAARRQGKRVGVTSWPGADGKGPRRRADWGMLYVNDPDRRAELVSIESSLWEPAGETARALKLQSHSPVQGLAVQVGSGAPGAQQFDLLAVDSTDDGKADYDGLVVVPPGSREGFPLAPGRWVDLPCRLSLQDAAPRNAVCPVKLLDLDLEAGTRLYFGGVYPLQAYPEDFASALAARKLFWPGAPDDRALSDAWAGKPGIDLETWSEQSDRFTRFFGDGLLAAAQRPGWDLLMGYMPVIDEAGHQLLLADPRQPGFSPERRDAFAVARRRVWQSVDRELARLLGALDLRNTVVVIVSDHGMTPIHTSLDPNALLRERGLLAADPKGKILEKGTSAYAVGSGGVAHVYLAPGHEDLLPMLRDLFAGWTVGGERPVERVLTRREAAEVHLDHPDAGDLVLFFREGYGVTNPGEGEAASPASVHGMHGYLNTYPDMHGIYLALGAGISPGNAGTVRNPEVAGRVAAWLGIGKPRPSPAAPRSGPGGETGSMP